MLKRILFPALACAILFSAAAARAQDPAAGAPAKPPWAIACDADIKKNCDAETKANSDVRPCLANHEADLSQACKDAFLRKYRVMELCKDDIDKVCAGATGKALGECFNDAEKQKQLSEKCKSALRQGTKEHKQETAAAAGDKPATADAKPAKPAAKGKHKKAAQ